jgi:NADPH:quinone reductase-like Zn-dependent oxidoreductase
MWEIPLKAVVCTKYGPPEVLQVKEVEKPLPKEDEVLIKVYATTVARGDSRMRSFTVPFWQWLPARLYLGINKPKRAITGMELSGVIESTGSSVKRFKKGDAVFSFVGFGFGANAEYKCISENGRDAEEGLIAIKPTNISFEEAAAATGGALTASAFLKKANIGKGQKVLIYGASGSVGTFAVQLAKCFGAEVTAVCSTDNLDLVRSIGADKVIDYTKDDFLKTQDRFDLIFDAVAKASRFASKRLLNEKGIFISSHDSHGSMTIRTEDLNFIKELLENGKLKPVIDRIYPLEQIVEAHRYVDMGHKKGNVVISMVKNE